MPAARFPVPDGTEVGPAAQAPDHTDGQSINRRWHRSRWRPSHSPTRKPISLPLNCIGPFRWCIQFWSAAVRWTSRQFWSQVRRLTAAAIQRWEKGEQWRSARFRHRRKQLRPVQRHAAEGQPGRSTTRPRSSAKSPCGCCGVTDQPQSHRRRPATCFDVSITARQPDVPVDHQKRSPLSSGNWRMPNVWSPVLTPSARPVDGHPSTAIAQRCWCSLSPNQCMIDSPVASPRQPRSRRMCA